jgi:hypothetical protein
MDAEVSRLKLFVLVALMVTVSGGSTAVEETGGSGASSLRVRAYVGGRSTLVFTADQLQWVHRLGERPGMTEKDTEDDQHPTFVDGQEWGPIWISHLSDRYTVSLRLPASLADLDVSVTALKWRGNMEARRTPQALLVSIDDTAHEGGDWYEFVIRLGPPTKPADGELLPVTSLELKGPADIPGGSAAQATAHADRYARAATRQRLAPENQAMQAAWGKVNAARTTIADLQKRTEPLRAELANWQAQVKEAEDKTATSRGYWYRTWRLRLMDRRIKRDEVQSKLSELENARKQAEGDLDAAMREYQAARRSYSTRYTAVYAEELEKGRTSVDAAKAAQEAEERLRNAGLSMADIAGEYTLVHGGNELGTVTLFEDGTLTTLTGEKRPDYHWTMTENGLEVELRDIQWVFKRGPEQTWLGTCTGPYPVVKGMKALLKRTAEGR